jgi:hypothetical protein
MRPGTNVTIQNALPPTTPPVNTGTWFTAGVTSQGPVSPQLCQSFAQWQSVYGARGTNPILSDSVETYFAQGGSQVYTARTVGPAAISAFVLIPTSSITVTAIGPGTYANGFKVIVATVTGGYTITIEDSNSNILEVSNTLVTVADAVAYGQTSSYVIVTANGTAAPTAGNYTLATGADDVASITTTQYANSLALFTTDLGPGRVSVPGITTTAVLSAVAAHCATAGPPGFRIGVGDLPDSNVAATLIGDVTPVTALGTQARYIGLLAPWMDIAPVSGTAGNRGVPPSAFYAGLAAKNDGNTGNPNLPIAGINGILETAVAAHATFSATDLQSLNTAGVNVIKKVAGTFRIYGNVTAVNRISDPLYFQLSNVCLDMAVLAKAHGIQEEYMFSQIDGNGNDAAAYGGELTNMMSEWQTLGALFPNSAGVFFEVDTASDVNTPVNEAQGILTATLAYARAPGAEQVNLGIVRASAATGV